MSEMGIDEVVRKWLMDTYDEAEENLWGMFIGDFTVFLSDDHLMIHPVEAILDPNSERTILYSDPDFYTKIREILG